MAENLNEYQDYPKWINLLTKEQQYEWYVNIKKSLPQWQKIQDTTELEMAIKEYETKNNIV